MLPAQEALERLRAGNERFVAGAGDIHALTCPERRKQVADGQEPFAIVLGCADSRAPAEVLFDHGLGDLFVIRVAGNVVAPTQIGSVEFAAHEFGTRLVVVLGHTNCGAIRATLKELERQLNEPSPNVHSIVDRIVPTIQPLFDSDELRDDHEALLSRAVRANVRASAEQLREGSPALKELIAEDGLRIVGAEYSLESGRVDFFDGID